MFMNLWYKIFGHPTVDKVMSDFQKIHDKLQNVIKVHGAVADKQAALVAKAEWLHNEAVVEMAKARTKVDKIVEWL